MRDGYDSVSLLLHYTCLALPSSLTCLFYIVLHLLQRMMIDCAHYVAQLIWVIGRYPFYIIDVLSTANVVLCFTTDAVCRERSVGDGGGVRDSRRGGRRQGALLRVASVSTC